MVFGWEWKTETARQNFVNILSMQFSTGTLREKDIPEAIILADEIVDIEGGFPDSFAVLTVIGDVYANAAINASKNRELFDKFIEEVEQIQGMASKHVVDGEIKNPYTHDELVNRMHLSQYYENYCTVGFARYLQSYDGQSYNEKHLLAIKPFLENAIILSPKNGRLKYIKSCLQ